MEACLKEELPSASELEEALRNGVILAKLAIFFHPEGLKEKNVYDYDQEIFKACFFFGKATACADVFSIALNPVCR